MTKATDNTITYHITAQEIDDQLQKLIKRHEQNEELQTKLIQKMLHIIKKGTK